MQNLKTRFSIKAASRLVMGNCNLADVPELWPLLLLALVTRNCKIIESAGSCKIIQSGSHKFLISVLDVSSFYISGKLCQSGLNAIF